MLDPLVASAPTDTDQRLQLSAADNLLGQISLEEGKIAQSLEYHLTHLKQFETAPESERRRPAVRHAISVTYGYLADAQVESGDLAGALESHRRSRALRRELSAEFPDNATYAELASSARYYEATVLGRLGRWEEALVLHRETFAEDTSGSFQCRLGEALAALGRHEEALGYFTRAVHGHQRELRADTASLFNRLAVVEDLGRICKTLAVLGRPHASAACARATASPTRFPWSRVTPFRGRFWPRYGPKSQGPTISWPVRLPPAPRIVGLIGWPPESNTAAAMRSGQI
jgi:tetratricopeptide (TPR) repeat protein